MSASNGGTELDAAIADATEALEWLHDYELDMFNVRCNRCGAPFKDDHYQVAAPAEFYGVLEMQERLARHILRLTDLRQGIEL